MRSPHWLVQLTHWGRVTHICVSDLNIIGSDNGLSPDRRQAIIWINARILLCGPRWINFIEISIEIHILSLKKMHLKMASGKWRPFCLGLSVLMAWQQMAAWTEEDLAHWCTYRWLSAKLQYLHSGDGAVLHWAIDICVARPQWVNPCWAASKIFYVN